MPRKIVRDIHKKGSFIISLQKEEQMEHAEKPQNLLDLSGFDKSKIVLTGVNHHKINDIVRGNPEAGSALPEAPEKVVFLHIDAEKKLTLDRAGELIRLGAAGILILFLINIGNVTRHGLSAKDNVVEAAFSGYSNLLQGGQEAQKSEFTQAENSFIQATNNFQNAINTIAFLKANQSNFLSKEKTVQSLQGLLEAGKSISQAGVDFSKGIENLRTFPALFLDQNKQAFAASLDEKPQNDPRKPKLSLTQKLNEDLQFLNKATAEIEVASDNLELVDENVLPADLKPKFKLLQEKVTTLKNFLHITQEKIPILLELLGDRYLHRYLILLQNDTEARPTGGFIGSYLIVDINDGYITKSEFHDVYQTDGQLKEFVQAPEDIAKITKNWRLRDSNYSPDFALSAEKAAWFLQKEKGPSVDTVIAVNQHFLADLFELTGPIQLDELKAPLTKDNYQSVLSYIVESKKSGVADPKKILRSFIPAFQEKLFTSSWGTVAMNLFQGARQGDVLFYSRDEDIQGLFAELGLSGHIIRTQPDEDYLNVINTSIGGNKSDLYIKQNLEHITVVDGKGVVSDQLTITRAHTWNQKSLDDLKATLKTFGFEELPEGIKFILGSGKNKSVVKVYVPTGSTLLSSAGIDPQEIVTRQDTELQKTFFMFEMHTDAGTEKKVSLTYQLPQNLSLNPAASYKFFAQHQPGVTPTLLQKKIILPPTVSSYAQYPETLTKDENGIISINQKLEKNLYLSVLVGK